tara:strand:- start:345 stop:788 length:444 start_codon:yes stop_codon:yes gene_type:complete
LISNTKFVHFQVEGGGHLWFNYDWGFHASEELLSFFMQYNMADFNLSSIENKQMSKNLTLLQNYPNPFNPLTTLKYVLPKDSYVDVTVYDMLGNVVNNLVNANQSSGYKSIKWNATNNQGQPVSAGVYLYKIQAGDFIDTKKMILLK